MSADSVNCHCIWPDEFCDRCERRFFCGSVAEMCPDCGLWRVRSEFHDQADADFNRQLAPERFHTPMITLGEN